MALAQTNLVTNWPFETQNNSLLHIKKVYKHINYCDSGRAQSCMYTLAGKYKIQKGIIIMIQN